MGKGHRPGVKGGYFPVPPVDSANDLRAAMTAEVSFTSTEYDALGVKVGSAAYIVRSPKDLFRCLASIISLERNAPSSIFKSTDPVCNKLSS